MRQIETMSDRPKFARVPAAPILHTTGTRRALDVLGDAWIIRLLRSSFRGARRFSEFRRPLGVSRAVLTDRLERMVADDLLQRIERPSRHPEYRLTPQSLDLWSAFVAMWQWERHWGTGIDRSAASHDRPRSRLVHQACQQSIDPVFACATCRTSVTAFETHGEFEARPAGEAATATFVHKRSRKQQSDTLPTLLRVFGDRRNTLLIGAAFQGLRTFSEFEAATGISPGPLSDRLQELQILGLFRSRAYAGSRREYRLTSAGIALYPTTIELMQWGNKWLWAGRPPMHVVHRPCGRRLETRWLCPRCQGWLDRTNIRFVQAST